MQSLYIEVTPAAIPEGIFLQSAKISALKAAFDILLLFLRPGLCIAMAYFSSLGTFCGVLYPNVDVLCRSVHEWMGPKKNSQWQFYRKYQNSELACRLMESTRKEGTNTDM